MAINSWFSSNLFPFFFAVFNGKIPKRSLGETFVVSSSNSTKRKKQKKPKSCPAGATSQGQNCAVLEQSWLLPAANLGKEMKQLKRNLKNSLFFCCVFGLFFKSESAPDLENRKLSNENHPQGWLSLPRCGSRGCGSVCCTPGRRGLGFFTWVFIPFSGWGENSSPFGFIFLLKAQKSLKASPEPGCHLFFMCALKKKIKTQFFPDF